MDDMVVGGGLFVMYVILDVVNVVIKLIDFFEVFLKWGVFMFIFVVIVKDDGYCNLVRYL